MRSEKDQISPSLRFDSRVQCTMTKELILAQMRKIIASRAMARSERLARFLEFTITETLAGHADQLKEFVIGVEVFDRSQDYDPRLDPIVRVEYLLGLEGMRKEGEHKQQAPPELLEEVFELNEALDELREAKASGGDLAALKSRLESAEKGFQEKLSEVDTQLQAAAREWDSALEADSATRKKIMAKLNDLLNRRSYIRNLVTNVQKELL